MNNFTLNDLIKTMRSNHMTIPAKAIIPLLNERTRLIEVLDLIYANRNNNVLANFGKNADLLALSTNIIRPVYGIKRNFFEIVNNFCNSNETIGLNNPGEWNFSNFNVFDDQYRNSMNIKYWSDDWGYPRVKKQNLYVESCERQSISSSRYDIVLDTIDENITEKIIRPICNNGKGGECLFHDSITVDQNGYRVSDNDTRTQVYYYTARVDIGKICDNNDEPYPDSLGFNVEQRLAYRVTTNDGITAEICIRLDNGIDGSFKHFQQHSDYISITVMY